MMQMEKREVKLRSNQKHLTSYIDEIDADYLPKQRSSTSLVKIMKKAFKDGSSLIFHDDDSDRKTIVSRTPYPHTQSRSLSRVINTQFPPKIPTPPFDPLSEVVVEDWRRKEEELISRNSGYRQGGIEDGIDSVV
jgi:hypothetical protein